MNNNSFNSSCNNSNNSLNNSSSFNNNSFNNSSNSSCYSNNNNSNNSNTRIFLDANGRMFEHILNYLRRGKLLLPSSFDEYDLLYEEVKYFGVKPLILIVLEMRGCKGAKAYNGTL